MESPRRSRLTAIVLFSVVGAMQTTAFAAKPEVRRILSVAPAWSGHPVGFALLTHDQHQYVAFYDNQRQMTVAGRKLNEASWTMTTLPEQVGWDSHNYITMAVDGEGDIHLCGNMHGDPLVYFRTTKPLDITTLKRVTSMIGKDEDRCTYPKFLRGPKDELIFTYRIGGSGNGNQIYNTYDPQTKQWRRLLDEPLLSGQGKMNAYLHGPVRDKKGMFHLCWVWRDTPDCATNHDLSYARSKDLVHWETSKGQRLSLPITIETGEIVDPVPVRGGMINGNTLIGFDSKQRPVISYHKYDKDGHTQLYNARLEAGGWDIYQTSDWLYRWEFEGGGSIPFEIRFSPVKVGPEGLTQSFSHPKRGSHIWLLDEETLKPIRLINKPPALPQRVRTTESREAGMKYRICHDLGRASSSDTKYVLKWETRGINRDRPHELPAPPPSELRLYEIHVPEASQQSAHQ